MPSASPADLEVTIESIGRHGDGIARAAGDALYVPYAAPGDRLRVRRGEGPDRAEILDILAPGPGRTMPACSHFGACGGCLLQHIEPGAYAHWKRSLAVEALAAQGLAPEVAAPMVLPPGTRRRVTLAARRVGRGVVLGFNERRRHRIVDLAACPVARPEIVAVLPALRAALGDVLAAGESLDVAVTLLDDGLDIVLVAGRGPDLRARERLAAFAEAADLARLSWRRGQAGRPGAAPPEPIAHRRPGMVRCGGVPVVLPPGGFLQASAEGEAALLRLVEPAVAGARRIADLFAGIGTFALPLAARATVLAADADAAAVAALDAAVRGVGLGARLKAVRRDLFRDPLEAGELAGIEAVVFDPPRAGAAAQAAALGQAAVPVVAGVSCNPVSFARDARLLVEGGYRLETVTPVDQFLWSPHVELVGVFRR